MATTDIQTSAEKAFEITKLGPFLKGLLGAGLLLGSVVALGFMIWGAVDWIISEGDKQKYEEARNKITHAVIGLAVLALVWLIWRLVLLFLGIGEVKEGITILEFKDKF